MNLRRLFLVCAVALGLTATAPAIDVASRGEWVPSADARTRSSQKSKQSKSTAKARGKKTAKKTATRKARRASSRSKKSAKVKLCRQVKVGKRTKRRCTFVREFQGHSVASDRLRADPLERPSGEVWLNVQNLGGEEAKVNIFKADGSYDEGALARLDELFRCRRTGEVRSVDPRLYEQLSRIYDHFGSKRIDLVSGFRFAERNSSRHFHASAMDIRIKGVTIREMYDYAESLDAGGMGIGIYPHSGFVHVDIRAPGEPSYRWTDYSGAGSSDRARRRLAKGSKKTPGRTARAKRPTS